MKKGVYYKLFIGTAAFFIMDICLLFIVFMHVKLNILIVLGSSFVFSYVVAMIFENFFNKNYNPDDNYNIQFAVGLTILVIIYILLLLQI